MNQIINYLRQPCPCPERTWRTIAIISALVFAVLFVFQPFGLNRITGDWKLWIILGYGAVTAVAMGLHNYLSPLLFPRFFDETRWTVGRHILNATITLTLVTLGNIIYGYVFDITWQHFDVSVFLSALLITVAVGLIPVVLLTVLRQNRLLATSLREVEQLNHSLAVNHHHTQSEETIHSLTLSGIGKDDRLEINPDQLLYIEACGNYVKVNYLKDKIVAQKMLRATIKQIEDATIGYPYIAKCHRAFIVNTKAVKQVSGNSQGYRLTLSGIENDIPVSRAYTSTIKAKIEQF